MSCFQWMTVCSETCWAANRPAAPIGPITFSFTVGDSTTHKWSTYAFTLITFRSNNVTSFNDVTILGIASTFFLFNAISIAIKLVIRTGAGLLSVATFCVVMHQTIYIISKLYRFTGSEVTFVTFRLKLKSFKGHFWSIYLHYIVTFNMTAVFNVISSVIVSDRFQPENDLELSLNSA